MKFLDIDLSAEDAKELTKVLSEWKERELEKMQEALEEAKEEEITKIEEGLVAYKQELEEEYIDKLNTIVESLKPQIRKQVLVEMNETNPEMMVLEQIKELIYPLVNESGKAYANEISLLKKELDDIKKSKELEEGSAKKEKLLEGYSSQIRAILDKMIGEGTATEITEKYYEIVETFQANKQDGDKINQEIEKNLNEKEEDDDDDEEDEEDDKKTSKKKKSSKKDDDDEDEDEDDDEDEDEDDEKNESVKLMDEDFKPTVESKTIIESTSKKPITGLRAQILNKINS